ncbi:glycosyltransferase family 4 protein [Methylomonas sp. UP202]|uniref:glycosyltransferase family 4 protein n=1 Tax=Methylomonas sp. UP202 TaxID=3040943 RepID=UPI00247A0A41|nr:glycosyltransferase family 4 protein [Methylomonas sp. UP202]WGS86797.1 glycosyltransferase family 4 protein [Methylomonas sp. UP202]
MKKVVILQHRLLHYRLGLFEGLRSASAARGIDLHLVHGQPTKREEKKRDVGTLSWASVVVNRYVSIGGKDILWQPYPEEHRDAELVVVMQENRLVSNYPWLLLRGFHKKKLAYWGHGRNFQTTKPSGLRERWKQYMVDSVDWWFAYTDMTRDILIADGYPAERITVLDNAIDNERFEADLATISDDRLREVRAELSIGDTTRVGLYCGSLYPDKRLDYLVAAADRIRESAPDFQVVIIGDGPSAADIQAAAESRPWLHWRGVRKGVEKAAYYRLADVILNPGLVGLHVLDAFCAGLPMVTTSDARHSPEIAYLKDGENGLVVNGASDAYADAIVTLLGDSEAYQRIRANALAAARRYTLTNMIDHFVDGMERCLAMERKK